MGALERQCAHIRFQEPQTKLGLFDTLVTPKLLYGVEICKAHNWTGLERPLVLMIDHLITRKAFVRVEMGAAPKVTKALL
jgi:hypothetical protein